MTAYRPPHRILCDVGRLIILYVDALATMHAGRVNELVYRVNSSLKYACHCATRPATPCAQCTAHSPVQMLTSFLCTVVVAMCSLERQAVHRQLEQLGEAEVQVRPGAVLVVRQSPASYSRRGTAMCLHQLRDEQLILNREKAELDKEFRALKEARAVFEDDVKREWVLPDSDRRVCINVGGQVRNPPLGQAHRWPRLTCLVSLLARSDVRDDRQGAVQGSVLAAGGDLQQTVQHSQGQ